MIATYSYHLCPYIAPNVRIRREKIYLHLLRVASTVYEYVLYIQEQRQQKEEGIKEERNEVSGNAVAAEAAAAETAAVKAAAISRSRSSGSYRLQTRTMCEKNAGIVSMDLLLFFLYYYIAQRRHFLSPPRGMYFSTILSKYV